jgi:hypothetical protein
MTTGPNRFCRLLKYHLQKGTRPKTDTRTRAWGREEFAITAGVSTTTLDYWKIGRSTPNKDNIKVIKEILFGDPPVGWEKEQAELHSAWEDACNPSGRPPHDNQPASSRIEPTPGYEMIGIRLQFPLPPTSDQIDFAIGRGNSYGKTRETETRGNELEVIAELKSGLGLDQHLNSLIRDFENFPGAVNVELIEP